jgi:hypothetical protein
MNLWPWISDEEWERMKAFRVELRLSTLFWLLIGFGTLGLVGGMFWMVLYYEVLAV